MSLPSPRLALVLLLATAVSLQAAPPSPDYRLVWADEFTGPALNTNEWTYRTGERLGSWQLPENVTLVDGACRQSMRYAEVNGKRVFSSAGIISKRVFPYGYYECRSKLYGHGKGMHSSFWTMAAPTDPKGALAPVKSTVLEIDGYEVDSDNPTHIAPNIHYYIGVHKSTGSTIARMPQDRIDSSADWFVSGFEWLPNEIRWYQNGRLTFVAKNPEFYAAQKLWLTALGTPAWGAIDEAHLPAHSDWDYVRYYRRDLVGVNLLAGGDFEWNDGPGFDKAYRSPEQFPHSWAETGRVDMGRVVAIPDAPSGRSVLRLEGLAGGDGHRIETWQDLTFLPAATYRLSAKVRRTPGWTLCQFAVKGAGVDRVFPIPPAAREWTRITFDDIAVTGGDLRVSIAAEAAAGDFLEVDQIEFAQMTGSGDPSLWKPHDPAKAQNQGGSQIWKTSSKFPGAKGPSLWCATPGAVSIWQPGFATAGKVRVSLYKIVTPDNDPDMKFTIQASGRTSEAVVDGRAGESGWEELGTFDFAGRGDGTVSFTASMTPRNTRLDHMKFERLDASGAVVETRLLKEPMAWAPPKWSDTGDHPRAREIALIADRGYLPPKSPSAFEPDAPITLGEWLALLYRVSGFWSVGEPAEVFNYFRRSMAFEVLPKNPVEGDLDQPLAAGDAAALLVVTLRQMGKEIPVAEMDKALAPFGDASSLPPKLKDPVARLLAAEVWPPGSGRLKAGEPLSRGEAAAWAVRALSRFVFTNGW